MSFSLNPDATCNTTTPTFAGLVNRQLTRCAALARRAWQDYQNRISLEKLDDHILRDVGFQRTETGRIVFCSRGPR